MADSIKARFLTGLRETTPELSLVAIVCLFFSTLFREPFGLPKSLVFIVGLTLVFSLRLKQGWRPPIWLPVSAGLISLSALVHHSPLVRLLIGGTGTNEGLLVILGLLIFSTLFSGKFTTLSSMQVLLNSLQIIGFIEGSFLVLQRAGIDLTGTSDTGHFVGTFGNEDFLSAFMGLAATAAILSSIYFSRTVWFQLLNAIASLFFLWALIELGPLQGLITVIATFISVGFLEVRKRSPKLTIPMLCLLIPSSYLFLSGIFGYGPFAVQLQQISMVIRSFLWRGAVLIWIHNPLFGSGIDSYEDFFGVYRDKTIIDAFSMSLIGDNAHNWVLQALATLGLIGTIGLTLPHLLVALRIWRMLRSKSLEMPQIVLISLYLNSFLIMMISPGVITNQIFFWLFAGALLSPHRYVSLPRFLLSRRTLTVLTTAIFSIALAASVPPIKTRQAESIIVSNLNSPNIKERLKLYREATENPFAREDVFIAAVEDLLGLEELSTAKSILEKGVKKFPHNYRLTNLRELFAGINAGTWQEPLN